MTEPTVSQLTATITQLQEQLLYAQAREAHLRAALHDLSLPCTRADYTVGDLDAIVVQMAKDALEVPAESTLLTQVRNTERERCKAACEDLIGSQASAAFTQAIALCIQAISDLNDQPV